MRTRSLRRLLAREDGIGMLLVVLMTSVLTLLSIVLVDQVTGEAQRSGAAVRNDAVFAAAEAGSNDYIAKLLDDPQFYDHQVANGESTRRRTANGATVSHGNVWQSGSSWTYPSGKDYWYPGTGSAYGNSTLLRGYAYNLQIKPPSAAAAYVTIVSTGCATITNQPNTCDPTVPQRAVELHVRRMTPADFQYMWGVSVSYGAEAVTWGKIYSLGDVDHDGTAHGDVMAEGRVTGSATYLDGAKKYDSTTTPKVHCASGCPLKNKISFSNFQVSLQDIQAASQQNSPSTYFNDPSAVWRFSFVGSSFVFQRCDSVSNPEATQPTSNCSTPTTRALPANGAIYTAQTAIISWPTGTNPPANSVVDGKVTLASASDIVIAGNISYAGETDDVLGLIANSDVWIAKYAPNVLTWRAATIAENGQWRSQSCPNDGDGTKDTMTFEGSASALNGGCMTMYDHRNYLGDDVLKFLFPPWYPVIDGAETTILFREVPPFFAPTMP